MIDLHTHVLPNIDDGSSSLEASLQMVLAADQMGVRTIVCTPHYEVHGHYQVSNEQMDAALTRLQAALSNHPHGVNLCLGHELYYHPSIIERLRQGELRTLAGSRYVLLEFSTSYFDYDLDDILYTYGLYGYRVIVAHVERYPIFEERTLTWLRAEGALFQINAETLLSVKHQRKALAWLKSGLLSFVSSDVHEGRPNRLQEAYTFVSKKLGKQYAEAIFITHPQRVIDNEEWPDPRRG